MAIAVYVQMCYEQVLGMPVPDLRKVVNVIRITIVVVCLFLELTIGRKVNTVERYLELRISDKRR